MNPKSGHKLEKTRKYTWNLIVNGICWIFLHFLCAVCISMDVDEVDQGGEDT